MESVLTSKFHGLVEHLRECWKLEEVTLSHTMKKRLSLQYVLVIEQMRTQLEMVSD